MSQSQALFVKWIKDRYPSVFATALKKVQRKSTLGGLGDDLISDVSVNPDDITVSPTVSQAVDNAASGSSSSGFSSFLDSLSSAITTVAPQIVQTKADLAAIQLNQQRAAQNRGPVTGQSLMTGLGLGGSSTLLLAGAAVIGAVLLMGSRRTR